MKRWIRWKGLGAFLGILIVLFIFWFFFVDVFVARIIEKCGTKAVGAKVELDQADVSLFPMGMELKGLQVTNRDKPMRNAVEISRISFSLEPLRLLRRKVIIDEMSLEGVRLDTPRKRSGAIAPRSGAPLPGHKSAVKKWLRSKVALPAFEIQDVHKILEQEHLESLDLVQSLRADIEGEKEKWQKRLSSLPGKQKLEEYRSRIQGLKSGTKGPLGGFLGPATELMAIQKDLKSDIGMIKQAQKDLNQELGNVRQRMDQARKAPFSDIERIRKKYGLSSQGLSNVTNLLFGPKVGEWSSGLISWYERLRPFVAQALKEKQGPKVVKPLRGKGVDVRFKEYSPLPDFLIRQAKASVELDAGDLKGQVENITPDQDMLGVPLTFEFSGERMKRISSVKITGALNHVVPSRGKDNIDISVKGYNIRDITLSDRPGWPITLKSALADLQLRGLLTNDKIDANLATNLTSVRLITRPEGSSGPLVRAICTALSETSHFAVKADITGTIDEYDIRLSSDLDQVIKAAAGGVLKKQAAVFEADLKKAIFAKVNGPLKDVEGQMGGLDMIGNELTSRLDLGNGLLGTAGGGKKGRGLKLPGVF